MFTPSCLGGCIVAVSFCGTSVVAQAAFGSASDKIADVLESALASRAPIFGIKDADPATVRVAVKVETTGNDVLRDLKRQGLIIEHLRWDLKTVRGRIQAGRLKGLAALPSVKRVQLPSYAVSRRGSVSGQHIRALGCDTIRSLLGADGSGVRVGVISDGIDNIAASQASGDAPDVTVPDSPRCHRGEGDEGAAMIEVIHDCAPGAAIGFCGPLDDLEMLDCAACLTEDFGADIIVDDLGFYFEPYFADGPIAVAVADAVRRGTTWFSAAGNDASTHYQDFYRPCSRTDSRHAYAPGDCSSAFQFIGSVGVILQWNEPFGAATSDYDLCVPPFGCSRDRQNGDDDPIEAVVVDCSFGCNAGVEIYRASGDARSLEVFLVPFDGFVFLFEHNDPVDSIFGHPCVVGAFAVGALDPTDAEMDSVQPYSSFGPCSFSFPTRERREKPDITMIDGILNTGPGDFPEVFFGTSAAAPAAASAAALLLQLDPKLSPAALRSLLTATAVDIEGKGFDLSSGFGRLDVQEAVRRLRNGMVTATATSTFPLPSPTPTITAPPAPTATPVSCSGDCNGDGRITVDELIIAVTITLGEADLGRCPDADADGSGRITVNELILGVEGATAGCVP